MVHFRFTRKGKVEYVLHLPDSACIHPVFHAFLLRCYVGPPPISTPSESVAEESVLITNEEETSTLASECLPTSTWRIEPTIALQSHVTYRHNFQTHLHTVLFDFQNPQYLCSVGYRSLSSSLRTMTILKRRVLTDQKAQMTVIGPNV